MSSNKLTSKIFISGTLKVVTGLHIGGSKTALDIGGIDLNVIKTSEGIPYIPGSSLKGKLRSLLAREEGSDSIPKDSPILKLIFGDTGTNDEKAPLTRIIVRDSMLSNKEAMEKKEGEFTELELDYTEGKWENTIDRKTGTAEHPRQLERVPAGAEFSFELVYNEFDDGETGAHLTKIIKGMRLLEDDYLGGSGTRGYGKIKFENVKFETKTISDYENDNIRKPLLKYEY